MPPTRLRRLMESTTAILLCLLIFVVRATITVWPNSGPTSKTYCILAMLACAVGIATNLSASKLALTRSTN